MDIVQRFQKDTNEYGFCRKLLQIEEKFFFSVRRILFCALATIFIQVTIAFAIGELYSIINYRLANGLLDEMKGLDLMDG